MMRGPFVHTLEIESRRRARKKMDKEACTSSRGNAPPATAFMLTLQVLVILRPPAVRRRHLLDPLDRFPT